MAYITNTKKIVEGSSISINDNEREQPLSIELKGNTTQDGTPTPDNPIDVVNVTGNQEINVTGKNLFNFETFSGFVSGITSTISGTNLKATGRATSTSRNVTNYTTNTFETGTYTFSLEHKIDTRILLRFYDDNNVTIRTTDIIVGNTSNTITLDGTEKKYRLILNPSNNQEVNIDVNLQFEKGSTPTKYEPYISKSYPISLGTTELCKIGDYQDKIYKQNGSWYLHKEIGKVVLNGSENWTTMGWTTPKYAYRTTINNLKQTTSFSEDSYVISDFYLVNSFENVSSGTSKYGICNRANQSQIIIRNDDYTTTTDFKNWLSSNNTTVYYVLSTATDTIITDTTLIEQLEAISLYTGINNITVSSNDLSGILKLDYYSTDNPYQDVIYSQEDVNKCKLYFNDVELEDVDEYLEKITFIKRVLPENGKKVFTLDNFIAEEVEIIIHDIDLSTIKDKVRIELGTLVNNDYVYVPMGVYNIQDTPTRNDNKITIKLRDNACLFDFNYNGEELIDRQGGTATKMQILQDICLQANVNCNVESFIGDNDLIGTYDSSVKARMYVAYLAEQADCIAKIDRYGNLIFVPLNNLYTHRIPLSIVSKYVKGTPFKIERIVYELGTIKFETSNDETLPTLYISSANPYISVQNDIDRLLPLVKDFELDSVEIIKEIIGNPAIDGYDLIEVYDDEDENEPVLFRTFANNTFIYNGKFKSKYKVEIGLEERTENTTNNGDEAFKKTIKSEINRIDGKITTEIAETKTYTDDKTNALKSDLQGQITGVNTDLQTYKQTVSTKFTQTTDSFDFRFNNITDLVNAVSDTENEHYEELIKYIRFVNGVIILGEEGNELTAELSNNRLSFKQNGNEVAYISNKKLYITDTEVLNNIIIGNFAFIPRGNGSLSFRKVR